MDVNSVKIYKVFSSGGDVHYVLPHFQREYAWEKTNWQTLLNDVYGIYETYDEDAEPEHFLGALVVINDGTRNGTVPAFKLVDGQQRLTTISLLLCALAQYVGDKDTGLYKKIRKLLINPDEKGILRYKLIPTTKYDDQATYLDIIDGSGNIGQTSSSILPAYNYIYKQLTNKIQRDNLDPEKLFRVIVNCMLVVFIGLDQRERPYEIFESLNAKGKPLTQPDLVRNYIAMRLPESHQENVFEAYWSEIEHLLQEKRTVSRIGELTAFLRHYLAFHSGKLSNKDHVYARFRDRMESNFKINDEFIDEIATLHRFACHYDLLLRPESETDNTIQNQLQRLNTLETFTAYPFLVSAYDSYRTGVIDRDEFVAALITLENYIVRRYLAGEPTNYLNKMFPTLWRELDLRTFNSSLQEALLNKNYPSDNRIRQVLKSHQIYDSRRTQKLCLILETVNRYLSEGSGGHTVLNGEPTVEHIMPQTPSPEWKQHLGSDWNEVYEAYLHTLGNLTLVTKDWNSSLSNSPFDAKKARLASHALLLNSMYFSTDISKWDENAILRRTEDLANIILTIWPAFGEIPIPQDFTGLKPKFLTIFGEAFEVKSWRDVVYQMAECVSSFSDNFDEIAESMPSFFSKDERTRSREMSNGWWVYINLSAESVMNLCNRLGSAIGLDDEDWEVEV